MFRFPPASYVEHCAEKNKDVISIKFNVQNETPIPPCLVTPATVVCKLILNDLIILHNCKH